MTLKVLEKVTFFFSVHKPIEMWKHLKLGFEVD